MLIHKPEKSRPNKISRTYAKRTEYVVLYAKHYNLTFKKGGAKKCQ